MSQLPSYREFSPPRALRRHVRCFWHLALAADPARAQTIYPDGCCELIGHRKTPMHAWSPATGWGQQAACLFAAQQRSAVRLAARADADCIGVRLQPAASALVPGKLLAALRDRIVDLADLDPAFAGRFRAAAARPDVGDSIAALGALLEQTLARLPVDARIEAAVTRLEACQGSEPIAAVIAAGGMGARSFQTTFKQQVGLSAKEFARIQRLQATIRLLDDGRRPVAELAIESGFADQSHATREVRRVTGSTPARLRDALRHDRDGDTSVRLAAAFVRGRLEG